MGYITIDVDIEDHLGDVSTQDLVEELKSRDEYGTATGKSQVYSILGAESLQDVIKVEAFLLKYKDIPESELDEFLSKY